MDIARAVTAKLWYKVIQDVQRIKQYKCTLSYAVLAEKYSTVKRSTPPSLTCNSISVTYHCEFLFQFPQSLRRGITLTLAKNQRTCNKDLLLLEQGVCRELMKSYWFLVLGLVMSNSEEEAWNVFIRSIKQSGPLTKFKKLEPRQ